jgi:hypothetical protein
LRRTMAAGYAAGWPLCLLLVTGAQCRCPGPRQLERMGRKGLK